MNEKARLSDLPLTLKRSLHVFREYRLNVIFIIILSIIRGVMPAVQMFATATLINELSRGITNYSALIILVSTFIVAYISDNLIKYLSDVTTFGMNRSVEVDTINKFQSFEVSDFENPEIYDLIQRTEISSGARIFSVFDSTRSTVQSLVSIFSVFFLIATWNIWVAIILLVAPIPAALANLRIASVGYEIEFNRAKDDRLKNYLSSLLTNENTKKEILNFNIGSFFFENYKSIANKFYIQDISISRKMLKISFTLGIISILANVFAISYAVANAVNLGQLGQLAAYITAVSTLGSSVMAIFLGISGIYQNLLFVTNWIRLMDTTPSSISSGSVNCLDFQAPPTIEFDNVSFSYPNTDIKILNSVSFILEPNKINTIVGMNGAGKTTILKLILRFYEPDNGSIKINGIPISSIDRVQWYKYVSAVFQDFMKYELPLETNIYLGDLSQKENTSLMYSVLDTMGLRKLPSELKDGLKTQLGRHFNNGHQLSIGQWQRVSIARSLFRKPKILLLDEPTASTDVSSENLLMKYLDFEKNNITIIMVAHRLSTIEKSDKIILLNKGRLIAEGSPEQLKSKCQEFNRLFN